MSSVVLAGLVLVILGAMVLVAARGSAARAAKLLLMAFVGASLTLAGLFALDVLDQGRASPVVAVLLLCGLLVASRYSWAGFRAARRGSGTPSQALAVVAGALMLLGIPYLLAGGYAATLGVFLLIVAAPLAGLSIVMPRVQAGPVTDSLRSSISEVLRGPPSREKRQHTAGTGRLRPSNLQRALRVIRGVGRPNGGTDGGGP